MPRALARLRLFVLSILATAMLTGCVTVRPASREEALQIASLVNVGDIVTCEMRSGCSRNFRVTAIKSGWLIGETDRVFAGDVARIEIQRKSVERVGWIAAGLALGGALAYLIGHPPVFTL
jgi:hypothetical protein